MSCSLLLFLLSDGRYGDAALVELDSQPDPVTRVHHQGALQDHSYLFPVRIRPERAHTHLRVQVNVVPKGNGRHPAGNFHSDLQQEINLAKTHSTDYIKEKHTPSVCMYYFI